MELIELFIGREINTETRQWLEKERIKYKDYSFSQVEYNSTDVQLFEHLRNEKKIFFITSQWSAKWLAKNYKKMFIELSDTIYCLSLKQAEICANISCKVLISEERNSLSLAQLVLSNENNKLGIYLKGDKSLDILKRNLWSSSIQYQEIEVYKNLPVIKKINSKFEFYIFFSPGGVVNFIQGGNKIPKFSKIIAIGSTTAKTCQEFFDNEIFISPVQEEFATVQYAANFINASQLSF